MHITGKLHIAGKMHITSKKNFTSKMSCPENLAYFISVRRGLKVYLPRDVIECIVINYAKKQQIDPDNFWEFGFIYGIAREKTLIYAAENYPDLLIKRDKISRITFSEIMEYITDPECFRYFAKKFPFYHPSDNFLAHHARSGHYEIIKFINETQIYSLDVSTYLINQAAYSGNVKLVKYIYDNMLSCNMLHDNMLHGWTPQPFDCIDGMASAAAKGNLEMFRYFFEHVFSRINHLPKRFACREIYMQLAVENNHLHIVDYIYQKIYKPRNRTGCLSFTCDTAAEIGNMEMVRYLYEEIFRPRGKTGFSKNAIAAAAGRGHLDVIKYIYEQVFLPIGKLGCTDDAICQAAQNNHVDVIKYIYETIYVGRRKKFNAYNAINLATLYKSPDALKYLLSRK